MAAGTMKHAFGQGHALSVSTSGVAARLARVGGVHGHVPPTSICRFVGEESCEQRPGRITDALGEAMVMHHAVDHDVFHRNDAGPIDNLPRFLVRKVMASMGNAFVDVSNHLAPLASCRRALLLFRQAATGPAPGLPNRRA